MRLFLGIGLPSNLAREMARSAQGLLSHDESTLRPRYVFPEDMHITLSFLGEVPSGRVEAIRASLTTLQLPPLQLELEGMGTFPRVGVLYAKVKASRDLLNLAEQVFTRMERCGFPREVRPYIPHVTLARVRLLRLAPAASDNPLYRQTFEAHLVNLYQSLSNGKRPRYAILHSFPTIDPSA